MAEHVAAVTAAAGSRFKSGDKAMSRKGDTMAKKKSKPESPFLGRWRIVSMSQWEDEYLNEEVQAYIEFDDRGGGSFQFGYMQGVLDYRDGRRDGEPAANAPGRVATVLTARR